ncbi:alpha,alpha-trehalose-phosphate synthase [UDP-forming] 1 isoform X2 [Cryptomeria japonica]|uniref:alpha,alpha-trehalose-phosphate synthase [UDP-forming] 1 isoform X2 n=1 Tax=Cryptomeria japonica TaxID=3369 RepID=UPI0025AD36D8|nr:alpha,alpha-trehalose-phosphate synthase [UDP-forming] 1 isoform X2 [Cryptomeria japonica]
MVSTAEKSRIWEGDDSNPYSRSLSSSSSSSSFSSLSSELGNGGPLINSELGNAGNSSSIRLPHAYGTTRVERLLRDRQLRKSEGNSNSRDSNAAEGEAEEHIDGGGEYRPKRCGVGSPGANGLAEIATSCAGTKVEEGRPTRQRLLVVANRLPVCATRKGEDSWSLEISAGGLVSALLGLRQFEAKWIGWAGVNVTDTVGQVALTNALAEKRCIPVFLDEELVHQYYNGYCNNILWPLFHYLGIPQEDRLATTRSFQSQFDAYKKANEMFADVVLSHYKEGDVVWCHDYHLMFLPKFLKDRDVNVKVGWFLHTPFPSSEIHRTLPSRSELLKAILAADLVGFHTYDYARHFVSACTRILGLEGTPEGVEDQGKLTRVAAFPIGIDSDRFIKALELPQVKEHVRELKERFAGRKVMLGVDRLDMIKGIPQKILAFEKFLEENPNWRDKVVLVQIAVPTRTDVPEYQKLTSQVHEIVGRINGRFGTLTTVPIHHLDRSLDFHALCALYAITDVTLITSLRDGMNLVSYEFVACQNSKKGVLILSEFAGAAQSLGAGAILVNPWNITEVASSIGDALNMSAEEREERHRHNFEHVTTHTAQVWAETFVSELNDTIVEAQLRTRKIPPQLPHERAIEKYQQSNNRLLILGFNATMTAQVDAPGRRGNDQIKEMKLSLHSELREPLLKLCNDPKTTIVVLSGSERSILDENFKDFNIWLAAENGMFLRSSKGDWMTTMPEHLNMDWVESVQLVLDYFRERTPRSYVEVRETSLVWNYKYADVVFGRVQARDMLQHLWTGPISNAAVDVVQGSRSVEVRSVGVSKIMNL